MYVDGSYLKGSCVRDLAGDTGRILAIEQDFIRVGWDLPDTSIKREEQLTRAEDRYRFNLEILTIDRGWAPLAQILPESKPRSDIVAEMRAILETKLHNPFRNKSRLGPGPEGDTLKKRNRWECSGGNYHQTCVGVAEINKGQVLQLFTDPEKKSAYNAIYKAYRKNKRRSS